jgi:hypothetical protein
MDGSSMSLLLIKIAYDKKPLMWEPCNNCGWCCLTEVCPVGVGITGSKDTPCPLLEARDGKHFCTVVENSNGALADVIGIGTGCDAATQREQLERIANE